MSFGILSLPSYSPMALLNLAFDVAVVVMLSGPTLCSTRLRIKSTYRRIVWFATARAWFATAAGGEPADPRGPGPEEQV